MSDKPEKILEEEAAEEKKSSKITRKGSSAAADEIEEAADDRCILCEKNKKSNGTDYCSKCLKELQKNRPPLTAVLAGVLTLALFVTAILCAIFCFSPIKRIYEARSFAKQGCMTSAASTYEEAANLADDLNESVGHNWLALGKKVRLEECQVLTKVYGEYYSGKLLSNLFSLTEIRADRQMNEYYAAYESYNKANTLAQPTIQSLQENSITAEEAIECLKALEEDNPDERMWIIYYESYCAVTGCEDTVESYRVQLEYLDRIKELYPERAWFYNSFYTDVYYNIGEYDKCLESVNAELENNRNTSTAYFTKMKLLLLKEDYDGASKTISDFSKYNDNEEYVTAMQVHYLRRASSTAEAIAYLDEFGTPNEPELCRQQALNYLADGKYASAFDAAYRGYNTAYNLYNNYSLSEYLTTELTDTLYLSTMLCQKNDPAGTGYPDELAESVSSFEGYKPQKGSACEAILKGEKSIYEALTEGTGDIF